MREKDITEAIQNYWQRKSRFREDLIFAYQKVKEAHDSDPASYSNAVHALFLFDDLLEKAESILKQCEAETRSVEHLVEGLIKYAENNLAINDYDSVIAAKGINSALAEKGANEYLPAGLLKRFEERREKIRKHPVPPLRTSNSGAMPTEQENPSRHSQRAEPSPYPEQQKKSCKSEIPEQELQQEADETSCANNENTQVLTMCIFTLEAEEEKWANIIMQFIADNKITAPLDGSMKNPTLAMIHHFYAKWQTQHRLLRTKIKAQDVLDFFIQKCGVKKKIQKNGAPVKDKTITNKIDGLKSGLFELNDTHEINKIEGAIKKVWKNYTSQK